MAPESGDVKHSKAVCAHFGTFGHGTVRHRWHRPDYSLFERKIIKFSQKVAGCCGSIWLLRLLLWPQPVKNSRRSAGANPPSTRWLLHDSNGTQSSKTLTCCLCCSDLAASFVNIPLFFFLTPVSPHLHKGCCSCSSHPISSLWWRTRSFSLTQILVHSPKKSKKSGKSEKSKDFFEDLKSVFLIWG